MANKKDKAKATTPENPAAAPAAPATDAAPKAKRTKKPKVEIPLTEAQQKAKAALDKANEDARAEILANSAGKIAEADKKIEDILAKLKVAREERKALNKALGIKGVFGGKKVSKFTFVKDFPEGKGAPQARAILEIVKAAGPDGVDRATVVKTMESAIKTNMDRSRLLSYYTSRMVADGVFTTQS